MKKHWKHVTAVLLALALMLGQTAFASEALGTEVTDRTVSLSPGVTMTQGRLWSATYSDLRTEHYVTYTPGTGAAPMVFSGTYVASRNTVSSAAAQLEQQGYRVVAGTNGGFFNTDGTIVGALITDGVLRSADFVNYTLLGFTADGRVFADESTLTKTVSWTLADGSVYTPDLIGFNAYRTTAVTGGLYLYNQDFSSKVNSSQDNVNVILRPVGGGEMKLNGSLTLEVVSVTDTTQEGQTFDGNLPEGCYMLYAETTSPQALLTNLRALQPGQQVTVSIGGAADSRWSQAVYGVSAMYTLVRDGAVADDLPASSQDPRTAIGIKGDGTVIFYTIDGRQSGTSVGAAYRQVAQRLIELGCTTAVALDGGGSTTMGATLPGSDRFSVVNSPSGGAQRAVNNSIFLVTTAPSTGMLGGYYVSGQEQVVLPGGELTVTAAPYDTNGWPVSAGDPSWTATGGQVTGTGLTAVYTAGQTAGRYQITAGANGQGSMPVWVVDRLSSLSVTKEGGGSVSGGVTLEPGQTLDLTASATWYNLPVSMDDGDVTWTVTGDIGTVDGTGLFVAGQSNGTGAISATAGGITRTVKVTVDNGSPFTDVPPDSWYCDAVVYVYENGVMNGTGEGTFSPAMKLSRAMLMTMLARLDGQDTTGGDTWYSKGLEWAVNNGISDGTNPDGDISREQLVTMLYRYMGSPAVSGDLSAFPDGAATSAWARDAVVWAVSNGLIKGGDGGLLNPQGTATRMEVATILMRFMQM